MFWEYDWFLVTIKMTIRYKKTLQELNENTRTMLKKEKLSKLQQKLKDMQLEHRKQCQPIKQEPEEMKQSSVSIQAAPKVDGSATTADSWRTQVAERNDNRDSRVVSQNEVKREDNGESNERNDIEQIIRGIQNKQSPVGTGNVMNDLWLHPPCDVTRDGTTNVDAITGNANPPPMLEAASQEMPDLAPGEREGTAVSMTPRIEENKPLKKRKKFVLTKRHTNKRRRSTAVMTFK